jgi:phosphocarrier protein HPr
MLTRTLTIVNKRGLHARAAAKFASTSALFKASIKTRVCSSCNTHTWVDGKSVMSLMLLAASQGTNLEIQADGEDAEHALEALGKLIEQRFDEGE